MYHSGINALGNLLCDALLWKQFIDAELACGKM